MATKTEQNIKSENTNIIQGIAYETLSVVFDELNIVENAVRGLWELALTTDNEKLKADIFEYLIDKNVPNPTQRTDVTSQGNKIESISVEIIRPDAS